MKPQQYGLKPKNSPPQNKRSLLPWVWGLLFFVGLAACSNDLSEVEATIAKYEPALESGKEIDLVYTEDGQTRIKLTAPRIISHQLKDPYYEFPEGLFVRFYSEEGEETSTLKADYAIQYVNEQETFFRDNVEVKNEADEELYTDELIWNEKEERIYSEKFVRIITPEERISGNGFEADQEFTVYKIKEITGQVYVESNETDEDL